jgi:predicted CXXCH cytochrome family protein
MGDIPFHSTGYGRKYYEADVPRLVEALERIATALERIEDLVRARQQPLAKDACEVCHGARGGVSGNEQRIAGRVLCDYCHADMIKAEKEGPCATE